MGKSVVWNLARYGISRRRDRLEGGPLIVTLESEEALTIGNEARGRHCRDLDRAQNHKGGKAIYRAF